MEREPDEVERPDAPNQEVVHPDDADHEDETETESDGGDPQGE